MKVVDHVMFTTKHKEWKVGDKLTEMENKSIAHFLASVSNSINLKIPTYLSDAIDVKGVKSLAQSLAEKELWEVFKALKSPGTSRKLSPLVFEEDKKLKKMLVEVAKALLVRETLSGKLKIDYPENPISELKVALPYEEDHINFTAKHGSWIVVKRLMIDEKTPLIDVARILASINETITLKLPIYAEIDVKGIEGYFKEFKKVRSESEIKGITEKLLNFMPTEYAPEEFTEHAKIYALRTVLKPMKLALDIPAKPLEKYLEKKA